MLLSVVSGLFSMSLYDAYYLLKEPVGVLSSSLSAAYVNVPQIKLPGVEITDGVGLIPQKAVFTDSDVSEYKDSLLRPQGDNALLRLISMAVSSLSPMVSKAVMLLDQAAPAKGDFIVNGTLLIATEDVISLTDVLAMQLQEDVEIKVDCDIVLSGKSFPNELTLLGTVYLKGGKDGDFILQPSGFFVNGEVLEEGYIRFKGALSQEV